MKKILALLFAAAMILLCACSEIETPDNAGSSDKVLKKFFLLTEEMRYDSEGAPYYKNTYTYDEGGRMTSRNYIRFAYDDIEELSYTETYSYNDRGHMISFTSDEDSELGIDYNRTYHYTYNEDGTVAAYSQKNNEGVISFELEYDQDGRFLRCFYLQDGNEIETYSCIYDENGKVKSIRVDPIGASFEYDSLGRVIKCSGKDWIEYQYEGAQIISEDRIFEGMKWTYTYSSDTLSGITLEIDHPTKFGEQATRKYVLNEHGKISKVQYDNGGWIEYKYQEIERIADENDLRYVYFNALNEPLKIGDYHRDVLSYALPKTQPDEIS